MIITSKILGTEVQLSLGRRCAHWAMVLAAGSIFLACSGTIETPTDEYPARSGSAAAADDDDDTAAPAAPRAPAAAANDDDDEPADEPAAAADDDDEPPVGDDPPAGDAPADDAETTLSFETDVWPILNTTCGPCHAGSTYGGNDIGDPDVATAFDEITRVGDRVLARIDAGTMPPQCNGGAPGDTGCIAAGDLETLEAWFDAGSPE